MELKTKLSQAVNRILKFQVLELVLHWRNLDWKLNKKPGYLRDILGPPTLLNMPFRRMKESFLKKTLFLYHIFQLFQNFFWFFAKKTSKKRWEDIFKKTPIETHSRKKMPHVPILKNFKVLFRKNRYIFPKNPKFWTFWEFLLFQSLSMANLLQFSEKNSRTEAGTNIVLVWTQLANIGLKKRQK